MTLAYRTGDEYTQNDSTEEKSTFTADSDLRIEADATKDITATVVSDK
ncbi:hypothetical protein [Arcobacter suis]|nr:hypothetical protein [Arcobacter suis]